MQAIFILNHVIENAVGEDSVKLIGIFSSKDLADKAASDHKELPGFTDYPDGFVINRIEIDKSDWNEGFAELENENLNSDGSK